MITAAQVRAARALLGLDQRHLAEAAGLSLPTIRRMEASDSRVRGNMESLVKLMDTFDKSGVELIAEGAVSTARGRGVRLKASPPRATRALPCLDQRPLAAEASLSSPTIHRPSEGGDAQ